MKTPRIVFVGGLHRSGTTMLADCLASHPEMSGFQGALVPGREGQHLQTVLPTDEQFGGPGRFALQKEAHLTESCRFATEEVRNALREQWAAYWDTSQTLLVEKSPVNVTRLRLLQALFPDSFFILIVRHPVPVSLSTHRWTPALSLTDLFRHWAHAHRLALFDALQLDRVMLMRYEDLTMYTEETMRSVGDFLGVDPDFTLQLRPGVNKRYFEQWEERDDSPGREFLGEMEHGMAPYGYALSRDPVGPGPVALMHGSARARR